ncbi:armadillo-type protein [Mycena amicta]|nr:armadillo-type protein [Mycena amicta]
MPEPNSTNELQPDPELYTGLVGLMASSDASTRTRAWFGLSYISDTLAGAQSVLRAGALTFAGEHLLAGDEDSDDDGLELAEWVCLVIGNISKYRSTLAAVLAAPEIVERIVSLVQNANTSIRRSAILALHNITLYHEGAQSVMAAGALECLDVDLIQREEDTRVLYWAARLLANLARHRVAGREGLTPRIREINEHPQADERVSRAARFASRKLDGKKSGRGSGRHP